MMVVDNVFAFFVILQRFHVRMQPNAFNYDT